MLAPDLLARVLGIAAFPMWSRPDDPRASPARILAKKLPLIVNQLRSLCSAHHGRSSSLFLHILKLAGMWIWVTRCLPGLSIIALAVLLLCAFTDVLESSLWTGLYPPATGNPGEDGLWSGLSIAQSVFVVYALLVHCHMFGFTLRLGWSIFRATGQSKLALERRLWSTPPPSRQSESSEFSEGQPPESPISVSSSDSLIAKPGQPDVAVYEAPEEELVHAIILPNYGEDLHTLETTLKVLASHPRAKTQYEVSQWPTDLSPEHCCLIIAV